MLSSFSEDAQSQMVPAVASGAHMDNLTGTK